VISYSGYLRPKKSIDFLYSRLIRIYPAYIVTMLLFIAAYSILPAQAFRNAPVISWPMILKSLVFDFGGFGGYIYVGWTLFYEMMFYFVFALISFRFARLAKTDLFYYLTAAGIGFCLLMSAPRVADFLIGVSIFLIAVNPSEKSYRSLPFLSLGAAIVASFVFSPVGVICGAFVLFLLLAERQWPFLFAHRKLLSLGDASYSIYLIQVLTLSASLKLAKLFADRLPAGYHGFPSFYIAALLIGILSTVLAGLIMRRIVEKPCYRLLATPRIKS
jgi:peptidoglycan/LPS O-acetylase OafA/YrhL